MCVKTHTLTLILYHIQFYLQQFLQTKKKKKKSSKTMVEGKFHFTKR